MNVFSFYPSKSGHILRLPLYYKIIIIIIIIKYYFQIQTPILTSNDCEGSGEVFSVLPASKKTIEIMKKESIQVLNQFKPV